MTRLRAFALVLAVSVAGGCAAHDLNAIDKNVAALQHECDAVERQGGDLTSCQQRFEAQATQALTEARKQSGDPLLSVALYRAAALAGFDAGPLGSQTVTQSSDEGTQACEHLPQKDASAPRDCTLIRLAFPLAVAADLNRKLTALVQKRDALRQGNATAQLPASDFPAVQNVYDGLETQENKVSAIRAGLNAAVPEDLKAYTDQQRRAIYCSALKAYSLAFDVSGVSNDALNQLTASKTALRDRTEESLGVIDCRSAGTINVPQ